MTVTINGNLCDPNIQNQYPNEPCTSVQVCTPGGSCATISNLLVDTGSFGLRVFGSVLSSAGVTPSPITSGGGTLAECVGFGDGSSEWGQVGTVDMIMGGESKITNVPILVIDSTYAGTGLPSACNSTNSTPDTTPAAVGFNGIIGVGLFAQDCGSYCTNHTDSGKYYSCSGSGANLTCTGATASLANQVTNPVSLLSTDNNGVIMQFPSIPSAGAPSVTGSLILGIGTRANNTPSGVATYATDGDGNFTTVFNPFSANALTSFIDSGSSLLFFPWPPPSNAAASSVLPDCGSGLSGFYCPTSSQVFAAANTAASGGTTSCVGFDVANANSQLSGSNMVFSNLAGASGSDISSDFDWGLPFFLGRQVYVGIENASSSLGTGPYWAY